MTVTAVIKATAVTADTAVTTVTEARGMESYRWSNLPCTGSTVEGCHLVPMKTPLAAEHSDFEAKEDQGGWGVKDALAANPGLTKIVSLIRVHPKVTTHKTPAQKGQNTYLF